MKSDSVFNIKRKRNRARFISIGSGLGGLVILIVGTVVLTDAGTSTKPSREAVETNRWIGLSEASPVAKFGGPTRTIDRYEQIGLQTPQSLPAAPIKTCVYEQRRRLLIPLV